MRVLVLLLLLIALPCYADAVLKPSVAAGFDALSKPSAIAADVELRSAQIGRDEVMLQFKLAGEAQVLELKLEAPKVPSGELDVPQFAVVCDRDAWRWHGEALQAIRRALSRQFTDPVWIQPQSHERPLAQSAAAHVQPSEPSVAELPFSWPQGPKGQTASLLVLFGLLALTIWSVRQLLIGQRK